MKSIFLSVVVICALAIAGIGGVFADYQDIDVSYDNYFETGDLNLMVSQAGNDYDSPNIPMIVAVNDGMPECSDKSFHFDLYNSGNYTQAPYGYVYLHVKNLACEGNGKTEPELAAETAATAIGELEDGTIVWATLDGTDNGTPVIGRDYGENCELAEWIEVRISIGDSPGTTQFMDLSTYDNNSDNITSLAELVCHKVYLAYLPSQARKYLGIHTRLLDIPEEFFNVDLFDETNDEEKMWNDWPTNALQNDKAMFDIAFELFQFQLP